MKRKQIRFVGYCLATGLVILTLTMVACSSTITSTPTLTLSSIAVAPASPGNLAVGSTQQFTATGTYSDGSTKDITSQVTWASSNHATSTISSSGLATGVAAGSTGITATLSGETSPAVTLLVVASSAQALSSIAVTPGSPPHLAVDSTQQFTATGTYSDGSTKDITSQVTWASYDHAISTISSAGLATGVAAGSTSITATLSGETSPAVTLLVIPALQALSSIVVTPTSPDNLAVGLTLQFAATGTYADGSTKDITSPVTWASSKTSIATISPAGLATGTTAGTTDITATLEGVTSPAVSLPVAILSSIAVSQSSTGTLAVGSTRHFRAVGTYADSSIADITSQVNWTSSDTHVATISPAGSAVGVANGTTGITASLVGITSQAVNLHVATLSSIAVTPTSPDGLAVNSTQQFTATGTYSDGSTNDITSQVTWSSSRTSIATISTIGSATGVAAGTTNITATLGTVTSPAVSLSVSQ